MSEHVDSTATTNADRPSVRRRGTVAGVVALLAAGGLGGVALGLTSNASAADSTAPPSSTATATGAPEGKGRPPWAGPGGRGRGHGFGLEMGMPLHGEFVTAKSGGGYQTIVTQRGKVSAAGADSITVKSDDGFSATYKVTADTLVDAARDGIATVKDGDTVMVLATKAGDSATAVSVRDRTLLTAGKDRFAPAGPDALDEDPDAA